MFTKIFHQYSHHAKKTLYWLPADTEDKYQKNLITQYQRLFDNNWIDRQFTYQFNSHGFRCGEFTTDPSIMFLGCSHTCGIGLPLENTWAYHVSKQLNLNMINLGLGGSGPDTAFKLANHYIPQLRPKTVVYLEPSNSRFYLLEGDSKIISYSPNNTHDKFSDYYNSWILNEENLILNGLKHKLAIEAICNKNNIKLVTINHNILDHAVIENDSARDLLHAGIKTNEEFSKFVLKAI